MVLVDFTNPDFDTEEWSNASENSTLPSQE